MRRLIPSSLRRDLSGRLLAVVRYLNMDLLREHKKELMRQVA